MEAKHDFILVFDGVPDLTDEVADALHEAGWDDGTFMMRSGRMYGAFHRVAPRMKDAVARAIRDVRRANIAARFVRVQRDLAETEVADDDAEMGPINSTIALRYTIDFDPDLITLGALIQPIGVRSIPA